MHYIRSVALFGFFIFTVIQSSPAVSQSTGIPPDTLILITEPDAATNANAIVAIALDRGAGVELFTTEQMSTASLFEYETNDPANLPAEIEFEGSTIGVPLLPGIGAGPDSPPIGDPSVPVPAGGTRGLVVTDFVLNSLLQNPSITVGMGIGFSTSPPSTPPSSTLINAPGADLLLLEIGTPVGQPAPSGAPASQGGDPFEISADGGPVIQISNMDYVTMGSPGQSGPAAFFNGGVNVPNDDLVEPGELETNSLIFNIAAPGLTVFATTIDLTDLGIADNDFAFGVNINSISDELPENDGFAPDVIELIGLPAVGSGLPVLAADGTLDLSAIVPADASGEFTFTVIPAVGSTAINGIVADQLNLQSFDVTENTGFNPPTSSDPADAFVTFTVSGISAAPAVPALSLSGFLLLSLLLIIGTLLVNRDKSR